MGLQQTIVDIYKGVDDDRRLPIKWRVFIEIKPTDIEIHVHGRRFIEFGGVGAYRRRWNEVMRRVCQEYGGFSELWDVNNQWLFPNFAYLLDGTDGQNGYGGEWYEGRREATFDVNGDMVDPGREGDLHPDDDFLWLKGSLFEISGVKASAQTNGWHPLGPVGVRAVVHQARSALIKLQRTTCPGKLLIELVYEDSQWEAGVIELPFELDGTLGQPQYIVGDPRPGVE